MLGAVPSLRCPHVRGSLCWGWGGVPSLRCPGVGVSPCQGVPLLGMGGRGSFCWGGSLHWGVLGLGCPRVRGSLCWGWGGGGPFIEVSPCQGVPLFWGGWGRRGSFCCGGVPSLRCPVVGVSPCQGVPLFWRGWEGVILLGGVPLLRCPGVGVSPCQRVPMSGGPFVRGGGGPFVVGGGLCWRGSLH